MPNSTVDDLDAKVSQRMKTLLLLSDSDESDSGSDDEKRARKTNRKGKKSGRARTADDYVIHEIDWPHLHVYRGASRTPARFEELSIQEFAFGYILSIPDCKCLADYQCVKMSVVFSPLPITKVLSLLPSHNVGMCL